MFRSLVSGIGICGVVLSLAACDVTKSSNPLSPTVAGPIPGVNITAPKALNPSSGSKVAADKQPLTLVVENASTSGVRPLNYLFEVATDTGFKNRVFARQGIKPDASGRTSLRLPSPLATGHTYYWRARAQDGANTGAFSTPVNFNVYTPIIIQAPRTINPLNKIRTTSNRPPFIIVNAVRSGPVGAISYQIEISAATTFATKVAAWTAPEQPSETTLVLPMELQADHTYYWHVRAVDATTIGPWSATLVFATPVAGAHSPSPTPPLPPPPTSSGPVPADAIDLRQAAIYNSPSTVASWPVTTALTAIAFRTDGVHVEFTKKDGPNRWPEVVPPGWSGGIQYTLWIVMKTNGQWAAAGPIEYWYGLDASGGNVMANNQIKNNWTYDCGPMARQPAPGELVGFFVTAGDQRKKDAFVTHERSNVVAVPFPSGGGQSFTFSMGGQGLLSWR